LKKLVILLLTGFWGQIALAQSDSTPIYLRFPVIPPFKITNISDSSSFTRDNLSKKKATIIMIFSPDCDHCQHEIKEITAHISLFKKVQFVMCSPLEFPFIKKFYDQYQIASYPNITMGRDPGYFFGTFYQIRAFPALFLYDKNGHFIRSFDESVPVERIAEAF
jgi:thioredoxin-related protein